jgi:hypothetical protein
MGWDKYVAHMAERRGANRDLGRESEGVKPLGRPRCRWEDNIKMNLQGTVWGNGLVWLWIGRGDELL